VGGGVPAAWAGQCQINDVGVNIGAVSNSVDIDCINIQHSTINGNVTNTGTGIITTLGAAAPTRTGIVINSSTINGAIINQGAITARSSPSGAGILVENNAAVSGGINNAGTVSAGFSQDRNRHDARDRLVILIRSAAQRKLPRRPDPPDARFETPPSRCPKPAWCDKAAAGDACTGMRG
jgi:hypothetical protein